MYNALAVVSPICAWLSLSRFEHSMSTVPGFAEYHPFIRKVFRTRPRWLASEMTRSVAPACGPKRAHQHTWRGVDTASRLRRELSIQMCPTNPQEAGTVVRVITTNNLNTSDCFGGRSLSRCGEDLREKKTKKAKISPVHLLNQIDIHNNSFPFNVGSNASIFG